MARARASKPVPVSPANIVNNNGQPPTEEADRIVHLLIANTLTSRLQWLERMRPESVDPRRDAYRECGWPKTGSLNVSMYQELYDRYALAHKANNIMAEECWQVHPDIYEDESVLTETTFEEEWKTVARDIYVDEPRSYYQESAVSPLWEYLRRVDQLSGIGHYGALLYGLDDGKSLDQPAQLYGDDDPPAKQRNILYIRCFTEALAPVKAFDTNPNSKRYGRPEMYSISLSDVQHQGESLGLPADNSVDVHWTRVQHVADNLFSSEVFGTPRLQVIFNNLLDSQKISGSSAEGYWLGAFVGMVAQTHPILGGNVTFDQDAMKDMFERYMNGLQRYLAVGGFDIKSLAPQVSDPTHHLNAQIDAICIYLGIPKRIFLGSERGQLASTQDDATWNDRVKNRQRLYVAPRIVVPCVNRLIALRVLSKPKKFYCEWPDLTAQTDQEKSTVALNRTQAMSTYVTGGVEAIMTVQDFLSRVLGMTEEEALAVVTAVRKTVGPDGGHKEFTQADSPEGTKTAGTPEDPTNAPEAKGTGGGSEATNPTKK